MVARSSTELHVGEKQLKNQDTFHPTMGRRTRDTETTVEIDRSIPTHLLTLQGSRVHRVHEYRVLERLPVTLQPHDKELVAITGIALFAMIMLFILSGAKDAF